MGLVAGINAAKLIKGEALNPLPTESAIGSSDKLHYNLRA